MKTPNEIKQGLECCQSPVGCENCPYETVGTLGYDCSNTLNTDVLTYIQQLEQELAAVKRERDALAKENTKKAEKCRYYTPDGFGGAGCLGTKEIDPCKGDGCERWKAKEDAEK